MHYNMLYTVVVTHFRYTYLVICAKIKGVILFDNNLSANACNVQIWINIPKEMQHF